MSNIRGSQLAFKNVFYDEPVQAPVIPITRNNGRNKELNRKRNECLIERYFFISRSTGKYYELVVRTIADEFFITEFHASKIIIQNHDALLKLKLKWKNEGVEKMRKDFSKKWAHLVW